MFDLSKFSLQGKAAIVTGRPRNRKSRSPGLRQGGGQGRHHQPQDQRPGDHRRGDQNLRREALPVQAHLAKMEEINRMVARCWTNSAGSTSW